MDKRLRQWIYERSYVGKRVQLTLKGCGVADIKGMALRNEMLEDPEVPFLYTSALFKWWTSVRPPVLALKNVATVTLETDGYVAHFEGHIAKDFDGFLTPREKRSREPTASRGSGESIVPYCPFSNLLRI
jgi:hypothetical protein